MDMLAGPLLKRFQAEPESYDLAIATCIVLYHFSDVVGYVRGQNGGQMANHISKKVPEFHTIRALANAGKHVVLTHHPVSELVGLRAEDLQHGRGAAFSDGTFLSDGSTFSDAPKTVVVETPDGRKHDVLHTCNSVFSSLMSVDEFFQV
ncbi:MAG: hypothetical protein QNJ15_09990 [Erythrobacter sp.]|nr:hypothetical protein [Erythrobacter sp.]